MDDSFENFNQKVQYKILRIAKDKIEQLEIVRFDTDAYFLYNSPALFFNHVLPEKILSTVRSCVEVKLFIEDETPDIDEKEIEALVESNLKSDTLQNKFWVCKKEISERLKLIKSKIIEMKSYNCSNDRLSLIYNCVLFYLIKHDILCYKTLNDSDNKHKALNLAVGLSDDTTIQKRKDTLIEPSFSAMQLKLNSRSSNNPLKLYEQLEYELEFYELLVKHYFTDVKMIEIRVECMLQSSLGWDMGETEFYRHVQQKIIDTKEFLLNNLYDEVDFIAREFTKINDSIIELNSFAEQLIE